MCGIAGWAGSIDLDEGALERMCDAVRHRGPDDAGFYVEPGRVGLGFRRLSIIDLIGGAQPLRGETGGIAATCNGEIYNFRALRERLTRGGHRFATGSDSETIVHAYEEEGLDFLSSLYGMFAIALWDSPRQRLVLARDRMGVKPLYYARVGEGILYGSEPVAILATGLVPPQPDLEALGQYLTLQYVPPPKSGFVGISKLEPGEALVFEGGRITKQRYWSLHFDPDPTDRGDEEVLDELERLLVDATGMRLAADVPLGAFLSGGVDSSLVVSAMAEAAGEVRTFSIDFPHADFSEGAHASRVAKLYGTTHESVLVEPDIIPTVLETVRHAGEPFADSSAIPTYVLSEMTRGRVTVALSGDGGDEAFAGYLRHRLAVMADRLGPAPMLARPLNRLAGLAPRSRRGDRLRRGISTLSRTSHDRYAAMMSHFEPDALERLATSEFEEAVMGASSAWNDTLRSPRLRGVGRYAALDTATYLPGDLLVKVDRMSMAHALEVRSPLLDHRVHEFAASLPNRMKLRAGRTKWALKELARRRGLPDDLVDRPKQGFGVPIGPWFRDELRGWLEGVLLDPRTLGRGYFDPQGVERLISDHVHARADHTPRLWNLAVLELWHRTFIDSTPG